MTIASIALNIVVVLLVLLVCVGVPLLFDFKQCRAAIAKLLGSGLYDYAYESVSEKEDDDDLAYDKEEEREANRLLRNELVRRPADPPTRRPPATHAPRTGHNAAPGESIG